MRKGVILIGNGKELVDFGLDTQGFETDKFYFVFHTETDEDNVYVSDPFPTEEMAEKACNEVFSGKRH